MARFNTPTTPASLTVNLAGGEAYTETPELELVSILLTSFVKDQFYRSADDTTTRLSELVKQVDKKFAAKAAIFARNEYGMRSITHVLAGEIAASVKGEQWTSTFFERVVRRPDDMTEILAYYISKYGRRPIPNSLKKGLANAFAKFDEYQLAKYRSAGQTISLVDVVNLVHPKASEKNADALRNLVRDELRSTDTWEARLTATGGDSEKKEEAWKELLQSRKLGYFALLRNLRNIIEQAPESLPVALEMLTDERLIRKSLVLPFRFLTAIKELKKNPVPSRVLIALNVALDISTKNVPALEGRTLVALDTSGSMGGNYRRPSEMSPAQIGSLFAAIIMKANPDNARLLVFDTSARWVAVNPLDTTLTIAEHIPFLGGGTDFRRIFDVNEAFDRIIILSDMQAWVGYNSPQSALIDYRRQTGADPKIYSFDLAGYGTLGFPERNVFALAGFSEKVFDIMKLLETDRKALLHKIEEISL